MTIERDSTIKFHELGTLNAVTRWITSHDEGIAEWLKNARRAYQTDRSNVPDDQRVAAILMADSHKGEPARIGLLDVGGATADDLTRWSVWQDPDASRPAGRIPEEETQGNGGKAYMYRLFKGPARIIGVVRGVRNAKGFEGPEGSVERGIPGFMPNRAEGLDAPSGPWKKELEHLLKPYRIRFEDLPLPLKRALEKRESFTLVEGVDPKDVYEGRILAENLIQKVARHDQSTLALEQMAVYAIHNGQPMFDAEPMQLEEIEPYPGFETPRVLAIPDSLPDESGRQVSTTLGGTRPAGRVVLRTSLENMPNAHRRLKPRWKVTYRTAFQMIGSKAVSELVPTTPGSQFVYATLELPALEPDYVTHGRVRPNEGPLIEAVDRFAAEAIRGVAREINERRRLDLDAEQLDEVARENRMLDRWKDRFLPSDGEGPGSGPGENEGRGRRGPKTGDKGLDPYAIEVSAPQQGYLIGVGVKINLKQILSPVVRDEYGRPVPGLTLAYKSDQEKVLEVDADTGEARGIGKGKCQVWVQVPTTGLASAFVPLHVWVVDHVLLAPRQMEIPVGKREQIVATVTNTDGERSTDVLLNWRHDADDPLLVRIRPTGLVTGNRVGTTQIYAGAGEDESAVWSRIPAAVTVIENPDRRGRGEGHPQLKLTGRDIDPETGQVREGDPEQPALWQEPSDVLHNIWWLNLEAPDAAFAFTMRSSNPDLWRSFHAIHLVEMVKQVHMQREYTRAEQERQESWAVHKQALERYQVQFAAEMWTTLQEYVMNGGEL